MVEGHVDYRIFAFPGNKFEGQIMPEINRLVDDGIVRVLDMLIVMTDSKGNANWIELQDIDDVPGFELGSIGMLSQEDIADAATAMGWNNTCALVVWENTWSVPLANAIRDADGEVVAGGYIPASVVREAELAHA
jgi:hypothetical protein